MNVVDLHLHPLVGVSDTLGRVFARACHRPWMDDTHLSHQYAEIKRPL